MKTICVIIARGGSKRLYRKNVKLLCGKPLVEWAIIQARVAHLPIGIYLSTDDDEIADIGYRNGIEVIRRPDWPEADLYAANVPICHALEEIIKQGVEFDTLIQLYPTAPCRHPDDIDKAILRYAELRRIHPDIKEMAGVVNPREMVVSKKIDNHRGKCVVFSKKHEYLNYCPVCPIADKDWYLKVQSRLIYDSTVDDNTDQKVIAEVTRKNGKPYYYHLCKWYQEYDIDDIDNFEFCELLMERYVLKGRGEKVYWDYKKSQEEAVKEAFAGIV